MKANVKSSLLKLTPIFLATVIFNVAEAVECVVSRSEVAAELKAGVKPAEIFKKYAGCVATDFVPPIDITPIPTSKYSTAYEEIKSCGYHPQRKEAACTVDIKQAGGYAGTFPAGSFEFVKFCVDYGGGLVKVNTNGFHINDAAAVSGNPIWNFAAVLPADQTLFAKPLNRQAYKARAILSWAVPAGGTCAAPTMIWGNVMDFKIRLDP